MSQALIAAWDAIREGRSGWFWVAGPLKNGDLYHLCSLADSFKKLNGISNEIYLIVQSTPQAKVAALFCDTFAEIIVNPDISGFRADWFDHFHQRNWSVFEKNVPILLHPTTWEWGQCAIDSAQHNCRTWMDIYKRVLRLPFDAEPSSPMRTADKRRRATELCEKVGMRKGRSVLFFPYAQSIPLPSIKHFAALSHDLRSDGYEVYTSTSGDEAPIEGTTSIFIPFDVLIEVAEYAGWVVAIRSGICDISSSAQCRKTFVFHDYHTLLTWSTGSMDLCHDATEICYPFTGDPSNFSALVRSGRNMSRPADNPRRLSPLLNADRFAIGSVTLLFHEVRHDTLENAQNALNKGRLSSIVVADIPPILFEMYGNRRKTLNEWLGLLSGYNFYTVRDRQPRGYFHEVCAEDYRVGTYANAGHWHSLVITTEDHARSIEAIIGADLAQDLVLRRSIFPPNTVVALGEFADRIESASAVLTPKPRSLQGLVLLSGWDYVEQWGVWTNNYLVEMEFSTRSSICGTHSYLEANFNACISPAQPTLDFTITVNGQQTNRESISQASDNIVQIPIQSRNGEATFRIALYFGRLITPYEQDGSLDHRKLGLGLKTLKLCKHG